MKLCPICAASNREGMLFCENCGCPITHVVSQPTRQFDGTRQGTARLQSQTEVILVIRETQDQIILNPAQAVIMGRKVETSHRCPDIDLSPYNAYRMGVSSSHAALVRQGENLTLVDKGSTNGTFLNGQRLIPNQPYMVRDGDEIRLGSLVAHLQFRRVATGSLSG